MPESPEIMSALGPMAALLTPVILLLFVALRFRQRIEYPHDLLLHRQDSKPAAAFLRLLRLYLDAVMDAAAAVVIGLAIAGFPAQAKPSGTAVIIDASLSMLAGMRGDRPIDEATRLVFSDEILADADLHVLGWDPLAIKHTIRNATRSLKDAPDPLSLAAALESAESFMTVDYAMLAGLRHGFFAPRKYEQLMLLTDNAALRSDEIDIRLLSGKPPSYLYPASATWDEDRNRSVVRISAGGNARLLNLWSVAGDGSLSRAKPEDYTIADSPAGFELSFPEPGLWAVAWYGHILPFEVPGMPDPLYARGTFAHKIVEALGPIGSTVGQPRGFLTVRDGGGRNKPGFISVLEASDEPFVQPPRTALGSVIAAGFSDDADWSAGSAALASPESAYQFWVARAQQSAAGSYAGSPARPQPIRVGDGFLYPADDSSGGRFIVAPVTEYTQDGRRITVALQSPADRRFLVALLVGCLYGLKLLVSYLVKK
jgi:hypothetical protein